MPPSRTNTRATLIPPPPGAWRSSRPRILWVWNTLSTANDTSSVGSSVSVAMFIMAGVSRDCRADDTASASLAATDRFALMQFAGPQPGLRHSEPSPVALPWRQQLFRRHQPGQVRTIEEGPDRDFAPAVCQVGTAQRPGDCLVHVAGLPDRKPGDQLTGLGERTVDHRTLAAFVDDALG